MSAFDADLVALTRLTLRIRAATVGVQQINTELAELVARLEEILIQREAKRA